MIARTAVDQHTEESDGRLCLVGNHHHPGNAAVCERHLAELDTLVEGVTRMTRELGYHLAPGSGAAPGDKVSTSRTGSPTPARLDVLSLIGPGVRDVRIDSRSLAVQVRRWSTVRTYQVETWVGGKRRVESRQVRDWHSELVTYGTRTAPACRCGRPHDDDLRPSGTPAGKPVTRLVDDQAGAVPPAEWLDAWVCRFRLALQHHRRDLPAGEWVDYGEPQQDKRLARVGLGEWVRINSGRPTMMRAVAAFLAVRVAYAASRAQDRAMLGLQLETPAPDREVRAEDVLAGKAPPATTEDPATAEWILRHGVARTAAAVEVDAEYLRAWLPLVALVDDENDHLELTAFTTELRALHRELEHVLGLTRDDQWIGRCPARLLDDQGNESDRYCGAGIWYDAQRLEIRSGQPVGWRIECPRCHSSWPATEWHVLAARIQYAWPIDMRRRYTAEERKAAELNTDRLPCCRGCETTLAVQWRPSPVRGDREPYWRPVRLFCRQGCLAGGVQTEAA